MAPTGSVLDLVATLAPQQPPRAAAEQFADKHQQERDVQVATLYRRVVATNNRNVTRDYGSHVVDETRPLSARYAGEEVMTPSAYQELAELGYGVAVTEVDRKKDARLVPKSPTEVYEREKVRERTNAAAFLSVTAAPRPAVLQAGTDELQSAP